MFLRTRPLIAAAAMWMLATAPSAAQVTLEFSNGRVNLSARNVPARTILAEWARLGGTKIVGGDRVVGAPVTLELVGVTEREALDIILREVPGYMLGARKDLATGPSRFDRIMVVPTTAVPRPAPAPAFASAPPPFSQNADPDDGPAESEAVRRAEELARRARDAADNARRLAEQQQNRGTVTGVVTPGVTVRPGAPAPFTEPDDPPTDEPPPPPPPGNPFMPTPGSRTPGTIAPVPQQPPPGAPRPVQ